MPAGIAGEGPPSVSPVLPARGTESGCRSPPGLALFSLRRACMILVMAQRPGYLIYQEPPRRPLTARNLEDFALCPQKFLLSFFVSPAQSDRFRGGPAALQRAARAALLACYREGGPAQVPVERLLEAFEAHWDGSLCADSLEEEQLHRQGQEMLRRYHEQHAAAPTRVLAVDQRLEAEIGGHRFVAVADRVDDLGQGTLLLRYRTTRDMPGPKALAKDLSTALLLLVGEAAYQRPAQAAIYALRAGRLVVAEISPAQKRAWEEEIVARAAQVRAARDYPTNVGQHCRVCRCRPLCPAWHPPKPEAEEGRQ